MAHVGQEAAFRLVGRLCLLLRLAQFAGTRLDLAFQPVTVRAQLAVAQRDLAQHFVEAVGELADFVIARPRYGHVIAPFVDHRARRFDQRLHRIGDAPLQPGGQPVGQRE